MKRLVLLAALAAIPSLAQAQTDEQATVDRATIALEEMMTTPVSQTPRAMLQKARAVLICPRVFKAGFFFGGSGGQCVLLARAGNGTWSYPAFYTIGSLSFGLQIGVQDSALVLMVMTDRGLQALLNSHFKLGAGGSVAIATLGGGIQGALTTGPTADIVAFESTRGVFAGVSLEGSVLDSRTGADQAYYRQPLDARQIVIGMQGSNPGADPLRAVLTRYGSPQPAGAYPYRQPGYAPPAYPPRTGYQGVSASQGYPPGYAPTYPPNYAPPGGYAPTPGYQPPSGGPIEQQNLPPPR